MIWTWMLDRTYRAVLGPPPPAPALDQARGLVLVADGVGGLDLCGTSLRHMATRGGRPYAVELVQWGHGFGRWYRDLTATHNHRAQAIRLADRICAARADHPRLPIHVVGKSGGTGIVTWALERLDPRSVDTAVLIAPALPPRYDLSPALRAVRGQMTVFWSPLDAVILGAGTWLFRTIDRRRAPSAGMIGFRRPEHPALPAEYDRLRQIRWRPAMARTGYLGGHVGPDLPTFVARYVIPLWESTPAPPAATTDHA
jgi:hypothetical protein